MPKATQLSELFKHISAGNQREALRVANEIAVTEESRGHRAAARMLRGSLNANGHAVAFNAGHAHKPGMFIEEPLGPQLGDVVLRPAARARLRQVIDEWQHRRELAREGLRRQSVLLFAGPPGSGKTITARALGRELGIPVLSVRLSSVVGAYLGQTAANLRDLFAHAERSSCVLLLDEVDALARARGRTDDVGELDRVVISLLQELDHSHPLGLIVAATNLKSSLDAALWRRFDMFLEFPAPTKRELSSYWKRRLAESGMSTRIPLPKGAPLSFADLEREVTMLRKLAVLKAASR